MDQPRPERPAPPRAAQGRARRTAAERLRFVHGMAALLWTAMIPISILTGLKNSVPYLVGLSVYALAVGHAASWQGSRAEVSSESNPSQEDT